MLPALSLDDLPPGSYHEIPSEPLSLLNRSLVLAWNSRLPRIRSSAKKLIEQLQEELKFH